MLRADPFHIRIATIAWGVMLAIVLVDALGGPLRFYLANIGLDWFVYIPKAFGLLVFAFAMLACRQPIIVWFAVVILAFSCLTAFLRGISPFATAFSVFQWSPFLLALVCLPRYETTKRRILFSVLIVWIISVVGVWLDFQYEFPWQGFEVELAGQTVEASREWTTFGFARPAGFARMSAIAALYVAITGISLVLAKKTIMTRLFFLIVTLATLVVTTNKASIVGMVGALFFIIVARVPVLRFGAVAATALLSVVLPLYFVIERFVLDLNDEVSLVLFASFDDRLANTWPVFFTHISSLVFGEGFGGVGATIKYFNPTSPMAVADNYPLYLIGLFGFVLGVLLFFGQAFIVCRLLSRSNTSFFEHALSSIIFFLLLVSITADVIEAIPAALALGIGIRLAYGGPKSKLINIGMRSS